MATEPKALGAWTGAFGDEYTDRNSASVEAVSARQLIWSKVLPLVADDPPKSALEVGANLGLNLRGLSQMTELDLWAVEPNPKARSLLVDDGVLPADRVLPGFGHTISLPDRSVDLVFTIGVLIHVDPSLLDATLREIHRVATKYIFCCEYFSPTPETISYRGETELLFKNDFGSLYMDLFPDLTFIECGFFWKRTTSLDNCTWWLFKKDAQ